MKPPREWEEEDLLELVKQGTQESIDLEYKGCNALGKNDGKKNEISKDVSAFANSAGGTIVYGMIEDGHVPTAIDHGFDPKQISKEWLEQVINSRIHRRIDGVKIKQINLSTTNPSRVAYVVCIPQSLRAPHQAADKKFYKRFNFESVPMEEYEIRDVTRRSDAPDLRVEMELADGDAVAVSFPDGGAYSKPIEFSSRVINNSSTPAEVVVFKIFIDSRLEIVDRAGLHDAGKVAKGESFRLLQLNWAPISKIPIFDNVGPIALTDSHLKLAVPRGQGLHDFVIRWAAHSPKMPVKEGIFVLRFDGIFVRLLELTNSRK